MTPVLRAGRVEHFLSTAIWTTTVPLSPSILDTLTPTDDIATLLLLLGVVESMSVCAVVLGLIACAVVNGTVPIGEAACCTALFFIRRQNNAVCVAASLLVYCLRKQPSPRVPPDLPTHAEPVHEAVVQPNCLDYMF